MAWIVGRMVGRMVGSRTRTRTLSTGTLRGLYFIHKYRFLTIAQFAKIANFSSYHAAEERRQAREEGTRQQLLQEFEDRAKALGFSLEQVFPVLAYGRRGRRSGSGSQLAVMYRGPHGETWSGRGRKPRWLQTVEDEGRDREEFRVPSA